MWQTGIGMGKARTASNRGTVQAATIALFFLAFAAKAAAQERLSGQCPGALAAANRIERRIIISVPDRKLVLVEDGRAVLSFPVSVGATISPSPSGEFRVSNLVTDPVYYHPGEVIPPGPENPVGPRWIGLSVKGIGIHGTNEPRLIGRRVSHGCIRLRNRDVKILFASVRVGDAVEIHVQRDAVTAQFFGNGPAQVLLASAADAKSDNSAESTAR